MTTKQTPAQAAGFAIGKQYRVTSRGGFDFEVGDVVEFIADDASQFPEFRRLTDNRTQYVDIDRLEPTKKPTPAIEAGLVVGTTYQMKEGNDDEYPAGTLVTFTRDDGSSCPEFSVPKELDSDGWNYIFVTDVEPVPALAPTPRTAVTFDDTVVAVPVEITIITLSSAT